MQHWTVDEATHRASATIWYTVTNSAGLSTTACVYLWSSQDALPTAYTIQPGQILTYLAEQIKVTNSSSAPITASFDGRAVTVSGAGGGASYSFSIAANTQEPYTLTWSGSDASFVDICTDALCHIDSAQTAGDLNICGGSIGSIGGQNVSVTAYGDLDSVDAKGDITQLCVDGDVTGTVSAAGDIGSVFIGGSLIGSMHAGNISDVFMGSAAGATIFATGDIGSISCGGDLDAEITAIGDMGPIQSYDGSITGYIDAGSIGAGGQTGISAMLDISASILARQYISIVKAGRNISGTIQASYGDIDGVIAGENLTADVSGENIGGIQAGLDVRGATVAARGYLASIIAGESISSCTISAEDGIGFIQAGPAGDENTLNGLISGTSILASGGDIFMVAAYGPQRPAGQRAGDISGLSITAAAGAIASISATGSLSGEVTAAGEVTTVSAQESIAADIRGSSVGSVASGPLDDIEGTITATSGDVGWVTAGRDMHAEIQALGGNIGTVTAGRDMLGNITAAGAWARLSPPPAKSALPSAPMSLSAT